MFLELWVVGWYLGLFLVLVAVVVFFAGDCWRWRRRALVSEDQHAATLRKVARGEL
jgi:hypothetical protein